MIPPAPPVPPPPAYKVDSKKPNFFLGERAKQSLAQTDFLHTDTLEEEEEDGRSHQPANLRPPEPVAADEGGGPRTGVELETPVPSVSTAGARDHTVWSLAPVETEGTPIFWRDASTDTNANFLEVRSDGELVDVDAPLSSALRAAPAGKETHDKNGKAGCREEGCGEKSPAGESGLRGGGGSESDGDEGRR